jgi:2-polyprenyl-6-methoxyphenol hydroxylase-like FAD-dependent oxidoreductase/phytoene/squalene synthetase
MTNTADLSGLLNAKIASHYDVIVVGGGPVGVVTAVACAKRGASVLILEADPRSSRRFAGEWLHPPAVEVLDRLQIGRLPGAKARIGHGFVIMPDDRSDLIELPYAEGVALSAEHENIVGSLRGALEKHPNIDYRPFTRVTRVHLEEGPHARLELERRDGTSVRSEDCTRVDVRGACVIGADGRNSIVRSSLGIAENSTLLSYMAGIEFRNAELPKEGFGHVVLGGPGPAIIYRIQDDIIRGCIDVPLAFGARARTPGFLWDAFSPVMPESLRASFREALETRSTPWAANRFRPRSHFGRESAQRTRPSVALVGDALGHVHPLTALGMTQGFLDAEALMHAGFVEGHEGWLARYGEARKSYIPEILSNALYHCFRREDPAATEVRRAMFKTLKSSAKERTRTMQIVAAQDQSMRSFSSAFMQIAARAMKSTVTGAAHDGKVRDIPTRLAAFGEWMQWPAATLVPSRLRSRYREGSTSTNPIPALAMLFQHREEPMMEEDGRTRTSGPVRVSDAIDKASEMMLGELERLAMKLGSVPDRELGGPSMHMMRVITGTTMKPAMAARMTMGRKRLAAEGVSRALSARERGVPVYDTATLANLMLVLMDGTAWNEERIVGLSEAVSALLRCEHREGGFGIVSGALVQDMESTAIAAEALDVLLRRRERYVDQDLEGALSRAAKWVRAQQKQDGSFGSLADTARAIRVLIAAESNPGEACVRRAVRYLSKLSNRELQSTEALKQVVLALSVARAPLDGALGSRATLLADAIRNDTITTWTSAAEAAFALSRYEALALARPLLVRTKEPMRTAPPTSPRATETKVATTVVASLDATDWAFCVRSLEEVSRTFSKPILVLPDELKVAVTLGYLLCRIADTIEDHPAVPAEMRKGLFRLFLDMMESAVASDPTAVRVEPSAFVEEFAKVEGPEDDAELSLSRNTETVMRVFSALRPKVRGILARWASEMARGMDLYTQRPAGDDGFSALFTAEDLDRYCYYVAGTVGHMLTDLFLDAFGDKATPEMELRLREDAESFAQGLQMVNILKDVTDDRARGVSFIPRTTIARQGLTLANFTDMEHRSKAHAAVSPLFDRASQHLDGALRYALTIPPEHSGIRLFCLLPLWMAVRTLVVARGSDAMFTPGAPVKISREEVTDIIVQCTRNAGDNEALFAAYQALRHPDRTSSVQLAQSS